MNFKEYAKLVEEKAKSRKSRGSFGFNDVEWFIKMLNIKCKLSEDQRMKDDPGEEVWMNYGEQPTHFYLLGEAKAHVKVDEVNNWIYDRVTGVVITNINMGAHEGFAENLYYLYSGKSENKNTNIFDRMRDVAHEWVKEGMGFMLSTMSRRIHKGEDVKLTAQEKTVFRGYEFTDI